MKDLLTTAELAERWGMHEGSLKNWRSKGKGPPYVKIGEGYNTIIKYKLKDIEEYEERNTIRPEEK